MILILGFLGIVGLYFSPRPSTKKAKRPDKKEKPRKIQKTTVPAHKSQKNKLPKKQPKTQNVKAVVRKSPPSPQQSVAESPKAIDQRRIMAESWCAYLTGYKMNSISVRLGQDGMLGKETAHQLCARVGLAMAAKLPPKHRSIGQVGRCIQGPTRIESPSETFYYRSFYWSNPCSAKTFTNGRTYVCCVLH